jgi:regulator of RNase E activity RraA
LTIQRSLEEIRSLLFTGVLSDVLDALGREGQVADLPFVQVTPGQKVVGFVHTARAVQVNRQPDEPYRHLLAAIDDLGVDSVLVISSPTSSTSSLFGGLLATAVRQVGAAGVVVDGFARDANEIRAIGVPTVVRGFRPLDSFGRDEVVESGQPVEVGGVLVKHGDLAFADEDGLVFVPADIQAEVIEGAFAKVGAERSMRAALSEGMPVATAFEQFGIL